MKIVARPDAVAPDGEAEARTRDRVCRAVLARGPVSAAELGTVLGLTPSGVRRHLDGLLADGLVAVAAPAPGRRGRGRPARRFVATDTGHAAMASGYDDLATSALRFLADTAGEPAVRQFARGRAAELEARCRPAVEAAGDDLVRRAQALADVLTVDGYAATSRPVTGGSAGVQLCQGHCPVQHVAREFPQLCDTETEAFSRLLGVHVQRLATLAHGEHVCTTHIPFTQTPFHVPFRASSGVEKSR